MIKDLFNKIPKKIKIIGGVILTMVIIAPFLPEAPPSKVEIIKKPEPIKLTIHQLDSIKHYKWVDKQFSGWDGSHTLSVLAIKKRMNDPKSFDHIKTTYTDNLDMGLIVFTTFTGKNAFGGTIKNTCITKIDTSGNLTSIKMAN